MWHSRLSYHDAFLYTIDFASPVDGRLCSGKYFIEATYSCLVCLSIWPVISCLPAIMASEPRQIRAGFEASPNPQYAHVGWRVQAEKSGWLVDRCRVDGVKRDIAVDEHIQVVRTRR